MKHMVMTSEDDFKEIVLAMKRLRIAVISLEVSFLFWLMSLMLNLNG